MDFGPNGHWMINGRENERGRIDAYPRLGTTEIWEFHSPTNRRHDMHLHGVHFQWLGTSTQAQLAPFRSGWKDTITIGGLSSGRMLVRFDGHPGVFMFHCHMLEHADHHMMAQFEVIPQRGLVGQPHGPVPIRDTETSGSSIHDRAIEARLVVPPPGRFP
jgi:spore coat protein A